MAKTLILEQDEKGCIIPTSHKLNKDGYFRKNIGNNTWVMYHRYMWEQTHGAIPNGFEVNHKCKNRACCNVEHLELLEGTEHAVLTNKERYSKRFEEAKKDWLTGNFKAKDLAKKYCVSASCAFQWVRKWKV